MKNTNINNYVNQKKGISLISLVVTIIAIIILASIIIYTGLYAPNKASLASFMQEISDFRTAVMQDYMNKRTKYALNDIYRSDAQIFYTIANGGDESIIENIDEQPSEDLTSGQYSNVYSLKALGVADKGIEGTYAFLISNDNNVEGWNKNRKYYEPGETHWVTDVGDVFILKGYHVADDGSERYYLNERVYTNTQITEEVAIIEKPKKEFKNQLADSSYGTEEKPYEIVCAEDLVDFAYAVDGIKVASDGTIEYTSARNYFKNKFIVLNQNINFKSRLSYEDAQRIDYGDINQNGVVEELKTELTTGLGWIIIGKEGVFYGSFDGNNNSINNLYINDVSETSHVGLFGKINSSTIENLRVNGNIYCNSTYAAAIVSYGNGEIRNCSFGGSLENVKENIRSTTGGIIGYSNNNCIIEKCSNKGNIKGKFQVGGILGSGAASISECYNTASLYSESNDFYSAIGGIAANGGNCEIVDCYNTGNVEGPRNVGGITGGGVKYAERCYNSGHIISKSSAGGINGGKTNGYVMNFIRCYNAGTIEGSDHVAGICGYNWVIGATTFDQCYNLGEIKGNTVICGITGHLQVDGSKMSNCYNFGKITGQRITGIAWGNNDKVKIVSCYNSGVLDGNTKYGISWKGNIKNCYYLSQSRNSSRGWN